MSYVRKPELVRNLVLRRLSEEVLATGTLVLYHHVNGNWNPFKGDPNSKSVATLSKAKNGTYTIKVNHESSRETLLAVGVTSNTTMRLQAGYETFYLLFDGKVYWGFSFADATVAGIFVEKTEQAAKALGSSNSDTVKSAKSTPSATSSTATKLRSPKTSHQATNTDDSSSSPSSASPARAGSLPGKKITSTVSETPLSKPTASPVKMSATVSEAVLGSRTPVAKPTANRASTQAFSTPPVATSSALGAGSSSTGSGSAPGLNGLAKRAAAHSSLPSSPHAVDDTQLTSSPSSKALKRPETTRKRAGTSLAASDDNHPKTKVEKSQRQKIIDEVLKTEEDYVDSLILIREKYLLPLKYAPRLGVSIFKPGDLEKIMYGIEPIFVLNTALLSDLKMRKAEETLYDCCGSTLHRYAPSMKLYIDYVNKYDNTLKLIKEYEDTSPVFKSFLQATSEDPESAARGIRDFWIMPVQRIPRYALLMNELLKNTPDTHSDYQFIKQALALFQEIAGYINDRKKNYDSQEKVALIQQRLNPKCVPVMRERRAWVAEGVVYIRNSLFIPPKKPITVKKGKPEPLPEVLGLLEVEFFLMNDLVLWATKDPKHPYLNELGRIPIHELITCEERPSYSVPFYDNTATYKAFSLRTQDHNEDTAPVFYCADHATADKWITTIKDTFHKAATARASELERLAKANLTSPK